MTKAKVSRQQLLPTESAIVAEEPPIVDLDFVGHEQNLLRIGFFMANDAKAIQERKLSLAFRRDGHRFLSSIEFASIKGLPGSSDRAKYLAFMRIVDEHRSRTGKIEARVRFSGRRLLRELGIADSGTNYEALYDWGQRMASTTITSNRAIWISKTKRYVDKTVHVFESFERVGERSGAAITENYEVVLASWLVENLNNNYVFTDNFQVYKKLRKPIAAGIFWLLQFWFTATNGRPVEKDYEQLTKLLEIKTYTQKTRIRQILGPPMKELVAIKYLANWDVKKRTDGEGYKVMLWAGSELLKSMERHKPRILSAAQASEQLSSAKRLLEAGDQPERQEILKKLKEFGISAPVSQRLARLIDPETIEDTMEYVTAQAEEKGSRVRSRQKLLVWHLQEGVPIPSNFVTSRQRMKIEEARHNVAEKNACEADAFVRYMEWKEQQLEQELARLYPKKELDTEIALRVKARSGSDPLFARISAKYKAQAMRNIMLREIEDRLELPSAEEWSATEEPQLSLFDTK
jgi:hypothetical protein